MFFSLVSATAFVAFDCEYFEIKQEFICMKTSEIEDFEPRIWSTIESEDFLTEPTQVRVDLKNSFIEVDSEFMIETNSSS